MTAPSRLSDVVAQVHANDVTRAQLEYLNGAAVRELISPSRIPPGGEMRNLALGHLGAGAGYVIAKQVGIDAALMRTRILVWNGHVQAGRWFGEYDVASADAWFAGNGGRREESVRGTIWRTAPDYQNPNEVTSPNRCQVLAEQGSLNVVQTMPGSFGWSVAHEPLTWLTQPATKPLAAEPAVAELAECLGDAVAAIIQGHSSGTTYAGGMQATPVDDVTEVLLARAESADQAKTMLDNATRACRNGGLLPADTEVTRTGPSDSIVRVAWRMPAGFPVGSFLAMLTIRKFEIFGS